MAYYRRLPSGKHQAVITLPNGKRITRSDTLKRVVSDWAKTEEAKIARGEWRDTRQARMKWEDWRDEFMAARVVESGTARNDDISLRNHLNPQWTGWQLGAITRMEVQGWVRRMHKDGVGPHAIRKAYNLLGSMLAAAVDDDLLVDTPCRRIDLPAAPDKLPLWFTVEEVDRITGQLEMTGHLKHAASVQLMGWCGLRWGEMAGLKIGRVSWLRRRLTVASVLEQDGTAKDYPKSGSSYREIPVPPHVLDRLAALVAGRPDDNYLFLNDRPYLGAHRPWTASNWRRRWYQAIDECTNVPRYVPHSLRHSAASWLVQDGVPLYDVQRLLGHSSFQQTLLYAHLAPDAHNSIEGSWGRVSAHYKRTATSGGN